jgi:hypothetical protein
MSNAELTELIFALATNQDGVVNRRQLIAAGASAHQVDSRVKNRSLRKLYAGVYAVGHDRLTPLGRQRAAVMAGGPNAVLSHRTAAGLLGLLPPNRKLEVIRSSSPDPHRPPPAHASRAIHPGLVIHRTRSLGRNEITTRLGIPVTSPIRTVINLAEREPPKTLDTMIRRGIAGNLFDLPGLTRAVGECRGRKGIAKLKKVLEQWNPGKLRTRSEFESEVADVCREIGAPPPLINDTKCGYEVDFQWKGSSVLLESDGHPYHLSRADRHRDYRKMLDLTAAGNTVVRIDEKMVFENRAEFAMKLRKLLEDEGVVELQPISPQAVAVSDRAPP